MNELLLAGSSLASALFTTLMWKLGKNRLYAAIIVFLILIASVGGKLVPVFGHVTNSGNIFYASVFRFFKDYSGRMLSFPQKNRMAMR